MDNGYGNGYSQQSNNNYNQNFGYEQQNMGYDQQNAGYEQQGMNYNQQNMGYNQQTQKKQKESKNYNNSLNTVGSTGVNLMVFVMLAAIFLMTRNITALMITVAVAFVLEKNKELWEVLISAVVMLAAIVIGYNLLTLLLQPISSFGFWLADLADYSGAIYKIGNFLYESTSKIRSLIGWVYELGSIGLGALLFMNVSKGKFKAPKFIKKYM